MIKRLFILIICTPFLGFSQQELKDDLTRLQNGEDLNVLYKNEASFGIYAHTNKGFGLSYRRGNHVTGMRKRMFEIETQNFKHPKEVKSVNSYFENSKGFNYGKLNSFFIIRPGVGFQNILYQKVSKKSVEIRYSYFIGGTMAFSKPVYLEVIYQNNKFDDIRIVTERYVPGTYNDTISNIYGKASFFKGIEKMSVYPGGYAKFALSFEYADRYNSIKAIETGAVLDVYPRVLPMMAYNKNQQIFVSLYLKMIWGKKWF